VEKMPHELLRHLRERRGQMVALLEHLTLEESPSAEPNRQGRVLDLLSAPLACCGYSVRRVGNHLYARSRERGRRRAQLLLGHCDTVWPLGTTKEMPVGSEGGIVRGPGVYDMKAGLVQMVFALGAISALGLEPSVTPVVFVNSDEEVGSPGSTRHIRRLARVVERTFVMEPSLGLDGKLKTARKGGGRFSVVVEGQAAHAGLDPEGGASAILELSYLIQELFALNDPTRGTTVNVGKIDGGLSPNVVAPGCSAEVDVRVATLEDARRVQESLLSLEPVTPGTKVRIEGRMGRPPMEPTLRNYLLWRRARSVGEALGLELEEATAGGASDGNTTSAYTATLDGLGAVGDGAHARHEFVYADAMVERSALLAALIMDPPIVERSRA
jgi:glutamate carboxypeptidase